jgi:hypothetical protein
MIANFGYDGGVVRLEIMQASRVVDNTREIQFALTMNERTPVVRHEHSAKAKG